MTFEQVVGAANEFRKLMGCGEITIHSKETFHVATVAAKQARVEFLSNTEDPKISVGSMKSEDIVLVLDYVEAATSAAGWRKYGDD